jgi:hypothetical protein
MTARYGVGCPNGRHRLEHEALVTGRRLEELPGQPRLPDARLAHQPDHLSHALAGQRPPALEQIHLAAPAHEAAHALGERERPRLAPQQATRRRGRTRPGGWSQAEPALQEQREGTTGERAARLGGSNQIVERRGRLSLGVHVDLAPRPEAGHRIRPGVQTDPRDQ